MYEKSLKQIKLELSEKDFLKFKIMIKKYKKKDKIDLIYKIFRIDKKIPQFLQILMFSLEI